MKDEIKLAKIFVEMELQNLLASLRLEQNVYYLTETHKYFMNKHQQKSVNEKEFLEIKLLCSLTRLF